MSSSAPAAAAFAARSAADTVSDRVTTATLPVHVDRRELLGAAEAGVDRAAADLTVEQRRTRPA